MDNKKDKHKVHGLRRQQKANALNGERYKENRQQKELAIAQLYPDLYPEIIK